MSHQERFQPKVGVRQRVLACTSGTALMNFRELSRLLPAVTFDRASSIYPEDKCSENSCWWFV
jgi:hypothetical protein